MPMDGVMLGFVARELDSVLRDGRVDRVIQPEKTKFTCSYVQAAQTTALYSARRRVPPAPI